MRVYHPQGMYNNIPPENVFLAADEMGNEIGVGYIIRVMQPNVFPDRPVNLFISMECQPVARYMLFGALVALVPQMICAQRKKAAGAPGAKAYIHRYVRMWAGTLLRIAGVTVTVKGQENIPKGRAVVFTPNHQGDYDIPLMLMYLDEPHALVAKIETKKIPLVRTWMKLLDCVFIDRKSPRHSMEAMRQAQALVQAGESVVVFPEGTRSKGDAMGEFKAGAFRIACKAGAPVVPVAIDGSYKIMEANHNLMKPAHVNITILPPVETAGLGRTAQHELAAQVAQAIAAAKGEV